MGSDPSSPCRRRPAPCRGSPSRRRSARRSWHKVDACGGNLTLAARRLGIARSTLYVRLAEYGYPRMPGGA
ncbi:helix-turn-helix domain-containing protein [Methylobacterium mesophilicum]|uniref:helix-turn-helix domain-containing protein n=1 Tax=Methylobacterium mesophilicum TaxID=39956 RepID=UPI0036162822